MFSGSIHAQVEVQDLREHDDAVQVEAVFAFEQVHQDGGARSAVAFTEEVLGRVPAPILAEIGHDEFRERVRVRVHAVKAFFLILPRDATEAGAGSVHKHQITGVQQAVIVVNNLIRRGRGMRVVRGDHPPGSKRAHVQPDRRRAGTAVEQKRDGPFVRFDLLLGIGHVKHRRFSRRILGSCHLGLVFALLVFLASRQSRVIPAFWMDDQCAGDSLIIDPAAFDGYAARAAGGFGLKVGRSDWA